MKKELSNYYINSKGELCITYCYSSIRGYTEYNYKVNGVAKNGAKDLFLTICK